MTEGGLEQRVKTEDQGKGLMSARTQGQKREPGKWARTEGGLEQRARTEGQ